MDAPLKLPSFLQDQQQVIAQFIQTNVTYNFVAHVIYSLINKILRSNTTLSLNTGTACSLYLAEAEPVAGGCDAEATVKLYCP